eukprot:symbB.v1.2.025694.t1/scaffold2510.1/size77360/3
MNLHVYESLSPGKSPEELEKANPKQVLRTPEEDLVDFHLWRVTHSMVVARESPTLEAQVLEVFGKGQLLAVAEEMGNWVRLHAPSGCLGGKLNTDLYQVRRQSAYMLIDGSAKGLGQLLQKTNLLIRLKPDAAENGENSHSNHGFVYGDVCTLRGHEERVWNVAWRPSSSRPMLASSGEDLKIRLWGQERNKPDWQLLEEVDASDQHGRSLRALAWDPNGIKLAVASFDASISVWRAVETQGIMRLECITVLSGHENEVKSAAFSSSDKFLASCSRDRSIWVYDAEDTDEYECVALLQSHSQDVKMVKWHPTQDVLFSCSYDNTIKVWGPDGDDWCCKETLEGHESTVQLARDWQQALLWLYTSLEQKLKINVTIYNLVIGTCERATYWSFAIHLLSQRRHLGVETADIVSFTTTMNAAGRASEWQRTLALLCDLGTVSIGPNLLTLNTCINACSRAFEWQRALAMLQVIPDHRYAADMFSYGAAILGSEKAAEWQQALLLLMDAKIGECTSLIIYNSTMSACEKAKRWKEAAMLMEMTLLEDFAADVITYNSLMSACVAASQWTLALCIFCELCSNLQPSLISYNTASSAFEKNGKWQSALALLEDSCISLLMTLWVLEETRQSLRADVISYNAVISACEKAAAWEEALIMLCEIVREGLTASILSFSAAISACGKAEQWPEALHLLARCEHLDDLDLITFNSAISACAKAAQWMKAMEVLEKSMQFTLEHDIITYSAVITACEKAAHWQLALYFLHELHRSRVEANTISYNATISACEKNASWQMSLALLEEALDSQLQVTEVSFSAAIGSHFVTCSDDRTLRVWAPTDTLPTDFSCVENLGTAQPPKVPGTAKDSKKLSAFALVKAISLRPLFRGDLVPTKEPEIPAPMTNGSQEAPKSTRQASRSTPSDACCSWSCVSILKDFHPRPVYSAAWSPFGDVILTACGDDRIRVFRPKDESLLHWECIASDLAHKGDVNCVAWGPRTSSSQNLLASAGDDGAVVLWEFC